MSINKSESIKGIAAALIVFQEHVSKIIKSEENPFFKSKYADLASILTAIKKPLMEAGLAFTQLPSGENELTTILIHATSGEFFEATYKMTPSKNDPQGAGSALTYMRRYALGAILGLNIDEDDDGNAASAPALKTASKPLTKAKDTVKFTEDELQQIAAAKIHPTKTGTKNGRKWFLYELDGQKGFVSQEQQNYITSFAPSMPLDELVF